MNLIRKFFAPCADLATRFRNKIYTDEFFFAKLQIGLLYFFIGALIIFVYGAIMNSFLKDSIYHIAVNSTGQEVEEAFKDVRKRLWIGRTIQMFVFAIFAYFLGGFAMRSIKKMAELQKRFIVTASHQLRTPLTVMRNGIEVALRKPHNLTREKSLQVLRNNLEETKRLSDIIEFLLAFSTFESRHKLMPKQSVRLNYIAQRVVNLLKNSSKAKNVTLFIDTKDPGIVRGNEMALQEMLVNLVKNAVSYTHNGGVVTVSIWSDKRKVYLAVYDTGDGISPEEKDHIFEPFFRGSAGKTFENRGGVGLGLAIVQEIVNIHRATIEIDSKVGSGTTVTVIFKKF